MDGSSSKTPIVLSSEPFKKFTNKLHKILKNNYPNLSFAEAIDRFILHNKEGTHCADGVTPNITLDEYGKLFVKSSLLVFLLRICHFLFL